MSDAQIQQPRIFVGTYLEYQNLVRQNMWNSKKIRIVNSVEAANRIRGFSIPRDDIYYGNSWNGFDPELRDRIRGVLASIIIGE